MSGMRRVKLITGVVVEDVISYDLNLVEMRYVDPVKSSPCYMSNELLATNARSTVIPIKRWIENYYDPVSSECKKEDGYIALSPEIDETLGKYIKIICSEYEGRLDNTNHFLELSQKSLKQVTDKIANTTFWERLKFLFTRSISFE